jgi:hypothetical protein
VLDLRHFTVRLISVAAIFGIAFLHAQGISVSSSDLEIPAGYKIVVDGTIKGNAPITLTVKPQLRHKILTESGDVKAAEFYLTVRVVQKTKEIENIPSWFVNPTLHQSDFPGHTTLTPATAVASTLQSALREARSAARSKMMRGMVNRYNTVRESQGKMDSSSSNYYPRLTRGQMDSLNDVNGGKMVLQSSPASSTVGFLEYDIQKIGEAYRVYVLAGRK